MTPRGSISRRLQSMIVLTTGSALALACALFIYLQWRASLAAEKQAALARARITADSSSAMLAFRTLHEAEKLLSAFHVDPNVLAAALFDATNKVFAEYHRAGTDAQPLPAPRSSGLEIEGARLSTFYPVAEGEKQYGTLYLQTDLRPMYARMARHGWVALFIFAGAWVAAYAIGRVLQQTISLPILSLATSARSVSERRDYRVRAQKAYGGELEVLTTAFNQMLDEIQRQQEALAREKELLGTTLASIGDAVIATNDKGRVQFLNGEAERLTGWKNAEAVGQPLPEVFRIVNETNRQPAENPVEKVLRLGSVVGLANHTVLVARDGTETPIDDSAAPIRRAGGPLFGVVLVFRNVTEQRKAQAAMRAKEQELEAVINRTPFMLTRCSRDLRYRFVSQAYAAMIGHTPEDIVGREIREIMGEEGFKTILPHMEKVLQGTPVEYESDVHFVGVGTRSLHVFYRPDTDEHGNVTGWIASILDVSDRQRAEAALREAHAQLGNHAVQLEQLVQQRTARLNETIGDLEAFSYSMVHDMRSPLRGMQSFAQLLADECAPLNSMAQDYLRRIKTAADRMDRLIQDGLNYSRLMRTDLSLTPTDVAALIRGMVETYPPFQPPQAEIHLQGPIPFVKGNESALTQCISNLLGNAVKFVGPGVKPSVQIWAEQRDHQVRLFFKDNGIGIEKESQERIFQIFQRLDTKYEGTGIGLAIARKAAERMGGRVGVESAPGAGSTFWLDLQSAAERATSQE